MGANRTAVAISLAALFVALGSGAYAAVSNLAQNSVGPQQIKRDAVGEQELAKNAVTSSELAPRSVGPSEMASDAIGLQQMKPDSVGLQQLLANAVNQTKIANDAIGQQQMQSNAVGPAQIQANAVGPAQMQSNAVGPAAIQAQAVQVANLADSAKTTLYTDNDDTQQDITTDTQIGSLSLPAGTYLVTSSIQGAHSGTGNSTRLECYLLQNGSLTLDLGKERLQASDFGLQPMQFAKEALSSPVTLSAPGTITYRCTSTNASTIQLTYRRLMALRVSNVVAQ